MRSLLLFDLSYSPNLALTLMSAHMRAYKGRRGSEKKQMADI